METSYSETKRYKKNEIDECYEVMKFGLVTYLGQPFLINGN